MCEVYVYMYIFLFCYRVIFWGCAKRGDRSSGIRPSSRWTNDIATIYSWRSVTVSVIESKCSLVVWDLWVFTDNEDQTRGQRCCSHLINTKSCDIYNTKVSDTDRVDFGCGDGCHNVGDRKSEDNVEGFASIRISYGMLPFVHDTRLAYLFTSYTRRLMRK